jgi:hypothetical protein
MLCMGCGSAAFVQCCLLIRLRTLPQGCSSGSLIRTQLRHHSLALSIRMQCPNLPEVSYSVHPRGAGVIADAECNLRWEVTGNNTHASGPTRPAPSLGAPVALRRHTRYTSRPQRKQQRNDKHRETKTRHKKRDRHLKWLGRSQGITRVVARCPFGRHREPPVTHGRNPADTDETGKRELWWQQHTLKITPLTAPARHTPQPPACSPTSTACVMHTRRTRSPPDCPGLCDRAAATGGVPQCHWLCAQPHRTRRRHTGSANNTKQCTVVHDTTLRPHTRDVQTPKTCPAS